MKKTFKEVLEESYTFPCEYIFKFIVPKAGVAILNSIFVGEDIKFRHSSKGNYVGVSVVKKVKSSDEILAIYNKVATIDGVISL
ncbi:MAG: DUF493 family protein [Bacteriovoracaceae bacterium]|nr:DUF493 family protein [Bacteriovoracaceae bacterium]